jgi:hypothetical protein
MNVVLFSDALLTLGGIKDQSALGRVPLVVNTVRYITNQGSV